MTKTVFLKPRFKGLSIHSLNYELIKNPPQSYKIITEQYIFNIKPLIMEFKKRLI